MAKSSKSPTQRTLAYLRERGWTAEVFEKWNAFAGVHQDAFGCIDIIALRECTIGIQATSDGDSSVGQGTNVPARVKKSIQVPDLKAWLTAGNRFFVIGWGLKRVFRGGPVKWRQRVIEIVLDSEVESGLLSAEVEPDHIFERNTCDSKATANLQADGSP